MGRHSSFNKETVLNNALTLFWSRGFAASSLRQLEDVTELHPGSLYHHFNNKEGLYVSVLNYYLEYYLQARITRYLNTDSPLEGLRLFLTTGYRNPTDEQFRNCCFLACTSTELHLLPVEAQNLVDKGINRIQSAFKLQINCLPENKPQSTHINTIEIAQELTCFFLGLQLLARIKPNQHQLDRIVKSSLHQILNIKA